MSQYAGAGAGAGAGLQLSQALSPPRDEGKESDAGGSGKRGLNALRRQGAGRGDETSSVVSIANSLWGPPDFCWICGLPFDYYYTNPRETNKEKLLGDYAFTPNKEKPEESFWIKPSCNSTGQIIFDYSGPMPTGEHISQARIWEAICGFSFKVKNFKTYSSAQKLLSKAGLRWSHHFCNMVKNDINLITFVDGPDSPKPNQQRIDNLLNSIRSGRVRKHDKYQHHYDEPSCWTYSDIDRKVHLNFIRALLTTSEEREAWFNERRIHMYQTVNNLCELLKAFKQKQKQNKISIIERIRHFLNTREESWNFSNIKDDFFSIELNIPYKHGKKLVACNNSIPEKFLSENLDIQKWEDKHNTPRDTQKFNEQYQALQKYKETKISISRNDSSKSGYIDTSEKDKQDDLKEFPIIKKNNKSGHWAVLSENNNFEPPPQVPRVHNIRGAGGNNENNGNNEITNEDLASALLTRENTLQTIAEKIGRKTNNLPNNVDILRNIGAHLDAMSIVAQKIYSRSDQSNDTQKLMKLIENSRIKFNDKFNRLNSVNHRRTRKTRKRNRKQRKTRKV